MKNYELKQMEAQELKKNLARLSKKKHKLLIAKREFEELSDRWDTEKAYYIEAISGMEKGVAHWQAIVDKSGKVQCRICEQWYAGSYIKRHMKAHEDERIQAKKEAEEKKKEENEKAAIEAEKQKRLEELRIIKLEEEKRLAEEAAIALAEKLKLEEQERARKVLEDMERKKEELKQQELESQRQIEIARRREADTKAIVERKAEELKEALNDHTEAGMAVDNPDFINKQECPECHRMITKGGAFAAHYKSHFTNGNGEGD